MSEVIRPEDLRQRLNQFTLDRTAVKATKVKKAKNSGAKGQQNKNIERLVISLQ